VEIDVLPRYYFFIAKYIPVVCRYVRMTAENTEAIVEFVIRCLRFAAGSRIDKASFCLATEEVTIMTTKRAEDNNFKMDEL
jgi:hypothetical protein